MLKGGSAGAKNGAGRCGAMGGGIIMTDTLGTGVGIGEPTSAPPRKRRLACLRGGGWLRR